VSNFGKLRDAFLVVLAAGLVIAGFSWVLSRAHWILGLILALAFVVAAVWLARSLKQSARGPIEVLAVLALAILAAAVVFAWVSFALQVGKPGAYSVPTSFSPGTFVDLYMITFLDLLPGIEVLKTLNLSPPVAPRTVMAALPILAFKILVVWFAVEAFLSWLGKRREAVPAPPAGKSR